MAADITAGAVLLIVLRADAGLVSKSNVKFAESVNIPWKSPETSVRHFEMSTRFSLLVLASSSTASAAPFLIMNEYEDASRASAGADVRSKDEMTEPRRSECLIMYC